METSSSNRAANGDPARSAPEAELSGAARWTPGDMLPSREMIFAVDDAEALLSIQDEVDKQIKHIEVDLEFRSDGDLDWERRARGALAAHNICLGHLGRRIRQIAPREKANPPHTPKGGTPEHISAKAAKLDAAARRVTAEKEAAAVRADRARLQAATVALKYAERTNWLAHFHAAAVAALDGPTLSRLSNLAHATMATAAGEPFAIQTPPTAEGHAKAGSGRTNEKAIPHD